MMTMICLIFRALSQAYQEMNVRMRKAKTMNRRDDVTRRTGEKRTQGKINLFLVLTMALLCSSLFVLLFMSLKFLG